MSSVAPSGNFSFTVGGSRLGDIAPDWRTALTVPSGPSLIKQEADTVVWRLALAKDQPAIVKLYRHRGAWSQWRGHILRFRVQREFAALCVLVDGRVPCSQPLAWGWGSASEHGRFEWLVTREILDAGNLKDHFAADGASLRSDEFLPLFDVLRWMHECGVYHGALWPKNILLRKLADGGCEFHVIDLARSEMFPRSIVGTSMARCDLLSLLYSLLPRVGGFDAEAMLQRHGYAPPEARRIAEQARRYRSSRHLRNRLAVTFQLRAQWERIRPSRTCCSLKS